MAAGSPAPCWARWQRAVFWCGLVLLVPIRMALRFMVMDPDTGFYTSRALPLAFTLCYGAALLLLALPLLDRGFSPAGSLRGRRVPGAAALVFAIALALLVIAEAGEFSAYVGSRALLRLPGILRMLSLATGTLSCLVVIGLAFFLLQGKLGPWKSTPLLSMVLLHQVVLLVRRFNQELFPLGDSAHLLELLLSLLGVLFLTAHQRVLSHWKTAQGRRCLAFAGYACALTAAVALLPEAAWRLLHGGSSFAWAAGLIRDGALGLYALVFTLRFRPRPSRPDRP